LLTRALHQEHRASERRRTGSRGSGPCARHRGLRVAAVVLVAVTAAACRSEPLQLNTIQLGRGLNPDNTVTGSTTRFKPTDTIYAAVLTSNAGSSTVKARWLYAGRVVEEPERTVSYRGPASTAFHLRNPTGFPIGDYRVELYLDGRLVGDRSFRVETDDPRDGYTFPNTTPRR
jgi:hypothetical protein